MSWETPTGGGGGGSDEWTGEDQGASNWKDTRGSDAIANGFNSARYDDGFGGDAHGPTPDRFDDGFGGTGSHVHAGGSGGEGAGGACRNCGQEGHFAREWPEPKKGGACFNCGEEGHSKAECPKPRVFKGTCKLCEKEGHRAADCPDKPPPICKNCRQEGHEAKDCTERRQFDLNHIADKTIDEALVMLKAASEDRDIDDFKDAFAIYTKADRNVTYDQAERLFRRMEFNIYLIGLTKEPGSTFTTVDLQGNINREFAVGFFLSDKAQRPKIKERWPDSPEVNIERLKNAGLPMDRGVPKCSRCEELGHTARQCPQADSMSMAERVELKCANCGESGHRVRDCPNERTFGKPRAPRECKVCGSTDHLARDCEQRQVMTCRNCGQEGHKAAECDQPRAPRDPSAIQCRNCDEFGHVSRECPKPRDYSRVTCTNCGEKGHTKVKCKEPPKENESVGRAGGGYDDDAGNTATASAPVGSWDNNNTAAGGSADDVQTGWTEALAANVAAAADPDSW